LGSELALNGKAKLPRGCPSKPPSGLAEKPRDTRHTLGLKSTAYPKSRKEELVHEP